jgi:hypothetical protein
MIGESLPVPGAVRARDRAGSALVAVVALLFALAAGAAPVVIALRLIGAGAATILPGWSR